MVRVRQAREVPWRSEKKALQGQGLHQLRQMLRLGQLRQHELKIDIEFGRVAVTGDLDKDKVTDLSGTKAQPERCMGMGAEEVETMPSRNFAIKEAEKWGRHGRRVWDQGRIFSRLGAFRPRVYAGQNNPEEGGN